MPNFLRYRKGKIVLGGISIAVLLIVYIFFGSLLARFIFGNSLTNSTLFLISRSVFLFFFIVLYFYAIKIEKLPFLLWHEESYPIDFYIVSVVALLALNYIGGGLLYGLLTSFHINSFTNKYHLLYRLSPILKFLGVLIAGTLEELIFRAYLIPRLQLYFKDIKYPIIISAVLFSLCHLGYGTILQVMYPLFFGLLSGYFYYRYRSIKILIICHFIIDYYVLLM